MELNEENNNNHDENEKRGRNMTKRADNDDANRKSLSQSPTRGRSKTRRDSSQSPGKSPRRGRSGSRRESTSPPKFGENSFDAKRDTIDMKRRQSAIAKVRGLKLDPADWTRQELIEKINKFCRYNQDKKSGTGELILDGKRIMTEDMTVVLECLRRFTEIQIVRLNNCNLNDESMSQIVGGLRNLRHLKELHATANMFTSSTVNLIVKAFSKIPRKLELLDLRNNNLLVFEDGLELYRSFGGTIKTLSGINTELNCKKTTYVLSNVNLSNVNMKLCEVGMLCGLLRVLPQVAEVDISRNVINSKCLSYLVDFLSSNLSVTWLDLSRNPLSNENTDYKGIDKLVAYLRGSKQLTNVLLDGIDLIPAETRSTITQSLQVNRSLRRLQDGYYFNKFITAHIEQKTAAKDAVRKCSECPDFGGLEDWQPKLTGIDVAFVRKNRIPEVTVEVVGDKILLRKKEIAKFDQYNFKY